jgi:putative salt-induced outer membrane protein YdiY
MNQGKFTLNFIHPLWPRVFLFLGLFLGLTPASPADVVYLKDGSRLMGTVNLISGGILTIETGFAGTLEINVDAVEGLSTTQPVTTAFAGGDQLVGSIEYQPEEARTLLHSNFGQIDVTANPIQALWGQEGENPEIIALRQDKEEAYEKAKPKWSTTLEAGATLKTGNTERLDSRGALNIRRKSPGELLEFYASAAYAEENETKTENEIRGGILYENKFYEKWYWYTNLDLEHDEFENLDLRTSLTAGIGYYWIEEENQEFKTRLGLGYRHESYDSDDRDDTTEVIAELAWDYWANIQKWARFTHSGTFEPSLEDFENYLLYLDTGLLFPLGGSDIWKLKLGVTNEFNSNPVDERDEWDNTYYANILLEWN